VTIPKAVHRPPNRGNSRRPHGYGPEIAKDVLRFLTTRPLFKREFTTLKLAERFYWDFRCGILHQAETGGDSKVWSVGPMLQDDGSRIIVNRNKFHEVLKTEFQGYLAELRDPATAELREHFRKKMNFISRA
jgi:hypothetical protein